MTRLGRDFGEFKNLICARVEEHLRERFARYSSSQVRRVGEYAALGAGHRWRAMAVVSAGRIFREEPLDVCLSPACAVELVHAATLILDDLPSMDDARVRRGKPCAHLVFSAWAVDMAPAFLVNTAYELILDNPDVSPRRRVLAALVCSGAGQHLCAGQQMDLSERRSAVDEKQLVECYRLKSGALYAASTQAGGIVCGAEEHDAGRLHKCGMNLGVAYQFLDDVADVEAGVDEVGKQSGMDAGKRTAVDLFGVEGARRKARGFQEEALSCLSSYGAEAQMLRELVLRAIWLDVCHG